MLTRLLQVALIEQALTGPGRAFAGIPVTTTGYVREDPDSRSAKGKILVQYTNEQTDDLDEPLFCPQQAIYKLWFEGNLVSEHSWPAVGDQVVVPNSKAKLLRRQECVSNATRSSTVSQTPLSVTSSVPVTISSLTASSPSPVNETASPVTVSLATPSPDPIQNASSATIGETSGPNSNSAESPSPSSVLVEGTPISTLIQAF